MRPVMFGLASGLICCLALQASAHAQTPAPPQTDQVDQRLTADRAALKAATRSRSANRVAAAHARLRSSYNNDWRDDHPQVLPAGANAADRALAAEKTRFAEVYNTGTKAQIAQERVKLRRAYHDAYVSHRRVGQQSEH